MPTLVLQALVSLFMLGFGVAALAVARGPGAPAGYREAWWLAGMGFTLVNLVSLAQNVWGTWAWAAAGGPEVMRLYLAAAPPLNHSRTTALLALFVLLALAPAAGDGAPRPARRRGAVALLVLGALAGVAIGVREKALVVAVHFQAVALLDALELVVVLSSMFVLLVRDRVDRLLWTALAVYAFNLALNGIWNAALINFGHQWTPAPWHMHAYRTVFAAVMWMIAVRRLRLARRGVPVPSLLEPPRRMAEIV